MNQELQVNCPKCGHKLSVGIQYGGKKGTCPECGEVFIIPEAIIELTSVTDYTENTDKSSKNPSRVNVYSMNNESEYRNFAWRRWSARSIDFFVGYLFALLLFIGLAFMTGLTGIGIGFWEWINENPLADIVLTSAIAYFSDVIIYAMFRTTLGKKINGISVCDTFGNRASCKDFFLRDIKVLVRGECLCIPLLAAIVQLLQYNRVCKGNAASYDEQCEYQARPTRGKASYDIILIIAVFIINAIIRAITKTM